MLLDDVPTAFLAKNAGKTPKSCGTLFIAGDWIRVERPRFTHAKPVFFAAGPHPQVRILSQGKRLFLFRFCWYHSRNARGASIVRVRFWVVCVSGFLPLVPSAGHAETISHALALAYMGNPDLNQQRAGTRATDESVARAKSGYRPQIGATASIGYANVYQPFYNIKGTTVPSVAGLTVSQNIFNGFRTSNSVKQAESLVFQSRESTRVTEQNTLQNGVIAYMNVLRDLAIFNLNTNNIFVLTEQLRETRTRLLAGDVTMTDIAQAEGSLATAHSSYYIAEANLKASAAAYRQVIGTMPIRLDSARAIDEFLPKTLDTAIEIAFKDHPAIAAALHNIDSASLQVQINQGVLSPSLDVVANVQRSEQAGGVILNRVTNSSVLGQLTIPIYGGGEVYAQVRQAKELLSQARLQADLARDQVRAQVMTSWAQLKAASSVLKSANSAVKAAEQALNGVREEAKVGQRTTYDVLVAQQTILQARISLISAQRDRVVNSYAVLAAMGDLSAARLGLNVVIYDPTLHLNQIKDKWFGLRTPDGQ